MSGLTPEAARSAAEWLDARYAGAIDTTPLIGAGHLHAEADRLEAAAKTPGQVLAESRGYVHWSTLAATYRADYESWAAAVIAHHVGPDRVVVDWNDLDAAINNACPKPSVIDRLREALS